MEQTLMALRPQDAKQLSPPYISYLTFKNLLGVAGNRGRPGFGLIGRFGARDTAGVLDLS